MDNLQERQPIATWKFFRWTNQSVPKGDKAPAAFSKFKKTAQIEQPIPTSVFDLSNSRGMNPTNKYYLHEGSREEYSQLYVSIKPIELQQIQISFRSKFQELSDQSFSGCASDFEWGCGIFIFFGGYRPRILHKLTKLTQILPCDTLSLESLSHVSLLHACKDRWAWSPQQRGAPSWDPTFNLVHVTIVIINILSISTVPLIGPTPDCVKR